MWHNRWVGALLHFTNSSYAYLRGIQSKARTLSLALVDHAVVQEGDLVLPRRHQSSLTPLLHQSIFMHLLRKPGLLQKLLSLSKIRCNNSMRRTDGCCCVRNTSVSNISFSNSYRDFLGAFRVGLFGSVLWDFLGAFSRRTFWERS